MRRIKILVVAAVAVGGALAAGLGAKAMPVSELQSSCGTGGGDWYSWVNFYEDDDGTLVGYTVSVCITPMGGYDSIRAYFDEDLAEGCFHAWNGGGTNCKTPWWDEVEKTSPTPTPKPTSTTTGTTSGTYSSPTATPRPMTTTTSGTTTSETYSR